MDLQSRILLLEAEEIGIPTKGIFTESDNAFNEGMRFGVKKTLFTLLNSGVITNDDIKKYIEINGGGILTNCESETLQNK